MVARNRPPRPVPDIQETLRLHMEATARCEEMMREVQRLREGGRHAQADKLERAAQEICRRMMAIEDEMRPVRPGD